MKMTDEQERFNAADKKVHPVETQWHYEYLAKYCFKPLDKEGIGFVRSYRYQRGEHIITCTTGCNADYWEDQKLGAFGYWADLEPHLKSLLTECVGTCTECVCTHEEKVSKTI